MTTPYDVAWRAAKEEPERFWAAAAAGIDGFRPWGRVLDDRRRPFTRWLPGALTNTCHSALDRHVKRLPKTRSGKILRGTLRRIADGLPHTAPATIDDPATLDGAAALTCLDRHILM